MIQNCNAPGKQVAFQASSPMNLNHSQQSSSATLNRNNSSTLVAIPTPLSNPTTLDQGYQPTQAELRQQQQQSQIIANIENNSINFEIDDDGFSQISFKHHLRQDGGNSSRGSLHNVYDNMSVSTTNTSATTRNFNDTDSNYLRAGPGLQEVQEAENDDHKLPHKPEKPRTSIFFENGDILDDQNYPKLYYRHSTFLLPTTAKTSRSIDEALSEKQFGKRRYSDTKLVSSLHFENEFLTKNADSSPKTPIAEDALGDKLSVELQNILELEASDDKADKTTDEKRKIFKSLPNLEMS